MRAIALSGLLAGLAVAQPAAAQRVAADVFVNQGPLAARISVGDRYWSSYVDRPVVIYRQPARRVVVVDDRPPVVYVERVHRGRGWWKRHGGGYRPVRMWYDGGAFYDRYYDGRPGLRAVLVFEQGGRFWYDDDCADNWNDWRGWDRDRYYDRNWDRDRYYDRDRDRDRRWDRDDDRRWRRDRDRDRDD